MSSKKYTELHVYSKCGKIVVTAIVFPFKTAAIGISAGARMSASMGRKILVKFTG